LPAPGAALRFCRASPFFSFDAPLVRSLGGPRFLADLWFNECGTNQRCKTFGRGAPILLLTALAACAEQDAAVVDHFLPRDGAQPVSGGHRQTRIERQKKSQLHGARDLVDVLTA